MYLAEVSTVLYDNLTNVSHMISMYCPCASILWFMRLHQPHFVHYETFDGKQLGNFWGMRHNDMLTIDDNLMIKYIKHLFSKIIVYEEIKMRFK